MSWPLVAHNALCLTAAIVLTLGMFWLGAGGWSVFGLLPVSLVGWHVKK